MNINVLWLMVSPLFSTAYSLGFPSLYFYSDMKITSESLFHILQLSFDIGKAGRHTYFGFGFLFLLREIQHDMEMSQAVLELAFSFIFNKKKTSNTNFFSLDRG